MKHNRIWLRLLFVNLFRFVLATTLLFSGWVKVLDPLGMVYKLRAYTDYFNLDLADESILLRLIVVFIAIIECQLGISLFLGIRRKTSSVLVFLFMLLMLGISLFVYFENPVPDCGCFGDVVNLTHKQSLIKNLFLLGMATFLVVYPRRMRRFITERNQWIISIYSFCFIFGCVFWNFHYIPLISFTDYKLGVNVLKHYSGETQEGEDLLETIVGLYAINDDGDDVIEQLLSEKKTTFILTLPNVVTADDSSADLINDLYDYANDNNCNFAALIANSLVFAQDWRDRTGASYPIYQSDEVILKSMVRSNPGLLLLVDGVLCGVWGGNELPEHLMENPIEEHDVLKIGRNYIVSLCYLLAYYIIPLLIVIFLDGLWIGSKYYLHSKRMKKILKK